MTQDKNTRYQFEIEKGIPIPQQQKIKYPFSEMEIGDSFLVNKPYTIKLQTAISCAARSFCNRKRLDRKFSVRKTDDNKLRIWRTK